MKKTNTKAKAAPAIKWVKPKASEDNRFFEHGMAGIYGR